MAGELDIEVISGSDVEVYNDSGVPERDVAVALRDAGFDKVGDALTKWVEHTRPTRRRGRRGGIFDRDRWLSPSFTGEKIHLARHALKDDVIGGAADGTEALAIDWLDIVTDDENEENIWNQILADLNITEQMKKGWRAAYTDSQFCTAVWWDTRSYKVEGKTDTGRAKRKHFTDMVVPIAMTYMDATKIIPVGSLMFGMEQLCYQANPIEAMRIDVILANRDRKAQPTPTREATAALAKRRKTKYGTPPKEISDFNTNDPIVEQLFVGRYNPDFFERMELIDDGVDVTNLFLLNPAMVYRHTLTRPDYQRFADVRLESCFELLDMKAQLRQMDRAFLIGGTHWILLITKGDKDKPALPEELNQLRAQAYNISSVPVIVADHRLDVKIVTPDQDHTLDDSKWDALDKRLFARAWGTFIPAGERVNDPVKLGQVIGRGLGSRRGGILTFLENSIIDRTRRMNQDDFKHRASLRCHPGTINIAFDPAFASFLLDLRAQNDTSRDKILSEFGMRQADEARMRERERKTYDKIFMTQVPHGTPNPINDPNGDPTADPTADPNADPGGDRAAQRQAGRRGGGRGGGAGAAPGSGQGKPARKPRHKANENQKRIAAMSRPQLLDEAKRLEIKGRWAKPRDELIALVQEAAEDALGDD